MSEENLSKKEKSVFGKSMLIGDRNAHRLLDKSEKDLSYLKVNDVVYFQKTVDIDLEFNLEKVFLRTTDDAGQFHYYSTLSGELNKASLSHVYYRDIVVLPYTFGKDGKEFYYDAVTIPTDTKDVNCEIKVAGSFEDSLYFVGLGVYLFLDEKGSKYCVKRQIKIWDSNPEVPTEVDDLECEGTKNEDCSNEVDPPCTSENCIDCNSGNCTACNETSNQIGDECIACNGEASNCVGCNSGNCIGCNTPLNGWTPICWFGTNRVTCGNGGEGETTCPSCNETANCGTCDTTSNCNCGTSNCGSSNCSSQGSTSGCFLQGICWFQGTNNKGCSTTTTTPTIPSGVTGNHCCSGNCGGNTPTNSCCSVNSYTVVIDCVNSIAAHAEGKPGDTWVDSSGKTHTLTEQDIKDAKKQQEIYNSCGGNKEKMNEWRKEQGLPPYNGTEINEKSPATTTIANSGCSPDTPSTTNGGCGSRTTSEQPSGGDY